MIPQSILDFLKLREGFKNAVYRDTLSKPTCGTGHLLTDAECATYHISQDDNGTWRGIGTIIPDAVLDGWLRIDALKAYLAASEQAAILGVTDEEFVKVLTSVNFQLGTQWNVKFPSTWHYMVQHEWEAAAKEAEKSAWAKQTPTRCKDFQSALLALRPQPTVT